MDQASLRRHRAANLRQTRWLASGMALLLAYIGWLLGGWPVALAGLVAVVLSYYFSQPLSAQILLRMHRAQPVSERQAPPLYRALKTLSERAGIPTPQLYIYPHPSPNAFATGSSQSASIALSEGLLNRLQWEAIVGVIGHEISHIRNDDLRLMGFADLASRITGLFSLAGLLLLMVSLPMIILTNLQVPWLLVILLILAPQISILLQMALSRTREFEADRGSAELIGSAEPLIKALRRIDPPQLSLFQRLVFRRHMPAEPSHVRSHPPTAERIARLEQLSMRQRRWSPLQVIGNLRNSPDLYQLLPDGPPRRHY
ncbi:MAG TPA: zinc metalloprotease HtpX [Motiliproteus sp.]